MKWYVLIHDFNNNKIEKYNIFNNYYFNKGVEKLLKNFITFDDFKEKIKNELMYSFWSKAEYEIMMSGLHVELNWDNFEKIDIYTQVLPNLDILCKYIIDEYNKRKRNKLEY